MTSQQPGHASATPVPDHASTTPTPLTIHADKPPGPTLGTRLVIFSALLLPSAVIPLLVLRRSVNSLHRKIDELKRATSYLHREFRSVMLELSVRREQHEQLRAMIAETREDLAHLRGETQRVQTARASGDEQTRNQIQELVTSDRTQISRLRELGTSLADVAAFMQEIELQQGFFTPKVDGRGIERLRFLAMQLEGMGKINSADTDSSAVDNLERGSDSDVGRRD
ncbi:hypothetical protein BJV78DRAFT_1233617 [Lactifluus subvellereus]|nr:hypothetical protein BJV78DRAFT_1233617 [Lactifluus subvellereus]